MNVIHTIQMDLLCKGTTKQVEAVQGDQNTRTVNFELHCGQEVWSIPEDASALIRYRCPDGTAGAYDTMPDGSPAWSAEGHRLTVRLAPCVLAAAGLVWLSVSLLRGSEILSTFSVTVDVQEDVNGSGQTQQGSGYAIAFLPQTKQAEAGQFLQVEQVDAQGRALSVRTAPIPMTCCVTITQNPDGSFVADKTVEQLEEAYQAGKTVAACFDDGEMPVYMSLVTRFGEGSWAFARAADPDFFAAFIWKDGVNLQKRRMRSSYLVKVPAEQFKPDSSGNVYLTQSYDSFADIVWNGGGVVLDCAGASGVMQRFVPAMYHFENGVFTLTVLASLRGTYRFIFSNGTWTPPA